MPIATRHRAGDLPRQLRSFVAVGIACTAAFALLYAGLRNAGVPSLAANALALAATMGINFTANRHLTFAASNGDLRRQRCAGHQAGGQLQEITAAREHWRPPLIEHARTIGHARSAASTRSGSMGS